LYWSLEVELEEEVVMVAAAEAVVELLLIAEHLFRQERRTL
jgi:hypothetical protein